MTISATEVFDKIEEYVEKNFKDIETIKMPYCSLSKNLESKEKEYRVQMEIKLKDDLFTKSAIAKVDAENGNVTMFNEGYTWEHWL